MIFEVEHSEYAPAGTGRLALLLRGWAWAPEAQVAEPPTLRVRSARGQERVEAAPGAQDLVLTPDAWTAFSFTFFLDEAVAAGDPDFALEPGAPVPQAPAAIPDQAALLRAALETLEAASLGLRSVADELPRLEERVVRITDAVRERPPAPADPTVTLRLAAADAERNRLRLEIAELQARLLTRQPAPAEAPAPVPLRPAEPTVAVPDTPPVGFPVPRPSRRRLRPTLPVAMFAVGSLAVTDAALTVLWKEPISSFYQSRQQAGLSDDLERLDVKLGQVRVQLPDIPSPRERMAALATRLDRDARAGDALGRLRIPRLDTSYVFVHGTGDEELRTGPGHYSTSPLPGGRGTVGIAGHRTTYGAPFRNVDKLRKGDELRVQMPYGDFVYRVEGTRIVRPSDTEVLRTVKRDRLVLTACHPLYSARERIIVFAALQRATPKGPALKLGTTRAASGRRGDAAA